MIAVPSRRIALYLTPHEASLLRYALIRFKGSHSPDYGYGDPSPVEITFHARSLHERDRMVQALEDVLETEEREDEDGIGYDDFTEPEDEPEEDEEP